MPQSGQSWNPAFLLHEPLFLPFEPLAAHLRGEHFPGVAEYTALAEQQRQLFAADERPLRFAEMVKPPRRHKRAELVLEELYDGSIALRAQVPCLNASYHDLLNALAFAAFPRAKRALHARQFRALQAWVQPGPRLPGKRTREQDALTIFDEGGVVLAMSEEFARSWQNASTEVAIAAHDPSSGIVPLLFGHALLEHLIDGRRDLRASAVALVVPQLTGSTLQLLHDVDQQLSQRISDAAHFQEPGADGIFTMTRSGSLSIGPPKPSWTEWNPGDREKIRRTHP